MKVHTLPAPATQAMYDQAIARYPQVVRSRAIAVYQVGNVRYPGLSDVDLLVVPRRPARDNQYFFSVFHRLPRHLVRLFLHEPFIVPPSVLEAIRFTTHQHAKLLYGEDVLSRYAPADGASERTCRLLESYCSYEQFALRARSTGELSGRWTIAVASALRFLLRDVDAQFGVHFYEPYTLAIDEVRAGAFEGGITHAVERAWQLFDEHFSAASRLITDRIGTRDGLAGPVAREILRGERAVDMLPREYARGRYAIVARYHDELERFGFPFGHMFFSAAYEGSVRNVTPAPHLRYVVRNLYRLQRRFTERAHA